MFQLLVVYSHVPDFIPGMEHFLIMEKLATSGDVLEAIHEKFRLHIKENRWFPKNEYTLYFRSVLRRREERVTAYFNKHMVILDPHATERMLFVIVEDAHFLSCLMRDSEETFKKQIWRTPSLYTIELGQIDSEEFKKGLWDLIVDKVKQLGR